jgi:hypothetical protein
MPESLSAAEVGKEIEEHRGHHHEHHADSHTAHERWLSIAEAVLLSIVALLAAWSGYSAAQWDSHASLSIAAASAARAEANRDSIEATQIATLDSVRFNAAFGAYALHNTRLFRLAVDRFRPAYHVAFEAWAATHPLKNPNAPPDPSYMPQYRIAQRTQARAQDPRAEALLREGQSATGTADKYVRLTVILAAVLFLTGISSHFPVRVARYGLLGIAGILLAASVVQLLGLPGPPS